LWTLVVRLLILGMSMGIGWVAGLLLAQVWPSRNPNPPIQERVMRQASQTVRKVRQLPQWWQGSEVAMDPAMDPAIDSASDSPTPSTLPPSAGENPSPIPEAETTPTEASPLGQEVATLQQELASLETRLAELEQQAGQPGTGDLADRLQQLAQQAATNPEPMPSPEPTEEVSTGADGEATNPDEEASEATTAEETTAEDATATETQPTNDGLGRHAAAPFREPDFPLVSDRIGLPSALLFEPESSLLTLAGKQLLDTIVPDLRRFGAVTFLVGSHTDGDISAEEARTLTFQQALAIQAYLAAQLEDTNSRWLTVGYGKARPTSVGDAPGTAARNQRIEIGIIRP
jgi:outer membrane protein OmpA-like peptidoglycan-associated protein